MTVVAAIGAVALALPVTASAAVTHTIENSNGTYVYVNPNLSVQLVSAPNASTLQIVGTIKSGGHTYYEYQDVLTGYCIQATTNDSKMAAGGCIGSNRQYWFWNSHVLVNYAFATKAYASGSNVDLGTGSGSAYDWVIS
jgi:hypothetical protein